MATMIEFVPKNAKLVQVTRDGEEIGWLKRTKNSDAEAEVIWSGIVDNREIKADTQCAARRQVRDLVNDHVKIDIAPASFQELAEYGATRRAKVRVAATHGAEELADITLQLKTARALAVAGETDKAVNQLAELKDSLTRVIKALNLAGITGKREVGQS